MAFRVSPIPQFIVDELHPLLSTRITVDREVCPHKHPLTVDVLLDPVLTEDGILYESHLRIGGSVGDPLFDEIWDSLSHQITLPDPNLRKWDFTGASIKFTHFSVRIDVPPEEAHDAVVRFFGRSGLRKVSFYDRPIDYSPLKVRSDKKTVRFAWEVETTTL